MLCVRIDFCESLCTQLWHSVSVTVSAGEIRTRSNEMAELRGAGPSPSITQTLPESKCQGGASETKAKWMHICRKAFAVTGCSPNIISGRVYLIRRSQLQCKKNAPVGTVWFFLGFGGFSRRYYSGSWTGLPMPAGILCMESSCHPWTTVCVVVSLPGLNSLGRPITYYTLLGHKAPNSRLPDTREKIHKGTHWAHRGCPVGSCLCQQKPKTGFVVVVSLLFVTESSEGYQNSKITKSQSVRGGKWPLGTIWCNPPAQAGPSRATQAFKKSLSWIRTLNWKTAKLMITPF